MFWHVLFGRGFDSLRLHMKRKTNLEKVKDGFFRGLGTALGLTVGFALVSTIIINIIKVGGGLPLVGSFFASIVTETQNSLQIRR